MLAVLASRPGAQSASALDSAADEQAWIDDQVARRVDRPVWAFVRYAQPAIILGRSARIAPAQRARAAAQGFELVLRRSGGGSVCAGPWLLGLNLLLPAAHPWSAAGPVAAFRAFGRLWQTVLQDNGVFTREADAEAIASRQRVARILGVDWACFAGLSHGELVDASGRKLLGLAQSRGPWGCLLSAGLLLSPSPWERFEQVQHGRSLSRSFLRELCAEGAPLLTPGADRALRQALEQGLRASLGD